MDISENINSVLSRIAAAAEKSHRSPSDITLVAATKQNDAARVAEAISAGITVCGENRAQELLEKNSQNAYSGAKLHFIGQLQKNKVKQLVGVCDLIQSVHSLELLSLINARADALGIVQELLLEINIGGEAAKSGMAPEELSHILEACSDFSALRIRGLMAIPPNLENKALVRAHFAHMYQLFVDNSTKKYDNVSMDFLSMGMSGDFEEAIAEGANMVRVGSAIFGARTYPNTAATGV
ncbi:MAG: YggS family pyridoxal phosphate-dependent enzyme [Oscillospiraceae bacterium]